MRNEDKARCWWSLPGGGVKRRETLFEAAIREVKEETGLDVQILDLARLYEFIGIQPNAHALSATFRAEVIGGTLKPQDPVNAVKQVSWVTVESCSELLDDEFANFAREVLTGICGGATYHMKRENTE